MKEPFNSIDYRNSYNKEHYDIMRVNFPKGTKQMMVKRAEEAGYINKGKPSVSAYLYHLFLNDFEKM